MFWIYGGGFFAGAGDFSFYDPTPLLEDDVIVVTFNYRLSEQSIIQLTLKLHYFNISLVV